MASSYFLLSDLNLRVKIKICVATGLSAPDLCQAWANRNEIDRVESFGEWLTFPIKYRDLPPTCRLAVTVWGVRPPLVSDPVHPGGLPPGWDPVSSPQTVSAQAAVALAGSTVPLFNRKGVLKQGRRRLFLWRGLQGDSCLATRTPYKTPHTERASLLDRAVLRYEHKAIPGVQWLDPLSSRQVERITNRQAESTLAEEDHLYLTVDLPTFPHPVVYHQTTCNLAQPEVLPFKERDRLFVLHDPEMNRESPAETKYHKLARSGKGLSDRDLKPKILERKEISTIIASPDKRLSGAQKLLLWKFRYSLTDNKRALIKFLRCIDWADDKETKEALHLLDQWTEIDIADGLELLSSYFRNPAVRSFGVEQLRRADDEELANYLLQLVQALRYEPSYPSMLSEFLIQRATRTLPLANYLHWFLTVEKTDPLKGSMFAKVHKDFSEALGGSPDGKAWLAVIKSEVRLNMMLMDLGDNARSQRSNVAKKVERLRASLGPEGEMKHMRSFEPCTVAVRPEIQVNGILGEESTMFTSKLTPLMCCFTTPNPAVPKYKVIFKSGDDLRQDQLMIQMINLMDSLLKKVKLDLQLTPYRVLATGPENGFVEYVPNSHTLTSILQKYDKDVGKFFQHYNPKPAALQRSLDNFVKSTAGYCVITYLLGIGDRHLDNLLLTTDGHLFHIDFGYIFGHDPKPLPPPMKFCKEMVDAMGGYESPHYNDFRKYAALAFHILRQHAPLILNLLSLMADANIPDLAVDPEKNLLMVQEKFRLDLSDEQADSYILALIDESVTALFPQLCEKIHQWALYWK